MNVAVVGGGKMGLPLACVIAQNGAYVTVCDVNAQLVDKINAGICPFDEPQLAAHLTANLKAGRLKAVTDTTAASGASEVIIVIVPALLTEDKHIDYGNLLSATRAISKGLKPETLVSYETTLPVGGCRKVLIPALEESGLTAGEDFYVAFSPERVKSLHVIERIHKTPKIVGGCTPASAAMAAEFYSKYLKTTIINLETLEAAELVKLAGMVYRDVNIALSNELASLSEALGIDAYRVFEAANTDGEAALLIPGIGVGGHCTPVYPYFINNVARSMGITLGISELSRRVNDDQPRRNVIRIQRAIGSFKGKSALILGLAFRPDVKEHTCSPAFALKHELEKRGAAVGIQDPYYGDEELISFGFTPKKISSGRHDVVILNTAHEAFSVIDFGALKSSGTELVLDGRNFWRGGDVEQAGIKYLCVGK